MDGTDGINKTHLHIKEIDIFTGHFYPPNNTQLERDINLVAQVGKTYSAGEYDWRGLNPDASSLASWHKIIEERQKLKSPVIVGDQFWSYSCTMSPTAISSWITMTD